MRRKESSPVECDLSHDLRPKKVQSKDQAIIAIESSMDYNNEREGVLELFAML